MPNLTRLTVAEAKDLDRVRDLLRLSYAELAERSKIKGRNISAGSVWKLLKGSRELRDDYAFAIYGALATKAEQEKTNRRLSNENLLFVQAALAGMRKKLERTPIPQPAVLNEIGPSSIASSHLVELVMALTDVPRLNLSHSFDYFHSRHFKGHSWCVKHGIKYRWLAYETPNANTLRTDWNERYVRRMTRQLAVDFNEDQEALRARIFGIEKQVDGRFYPYVQLEKEWQENVRLREKYRLGQRIPFRVTVFESIVCVCTEEPEPRRYPFGQTAVLRSPSFFDLQHILNDLFKICPTIDLIGTPEARDYVRANARQLLEDHNKLREAFLRAVLAPVPRVPDAEEGSYLEVKP